MISLSHHDYVYSKMCLEKCLDYEKDCQTLRELISISNNFEDAEKYLDLALSFYSHITDSYEIDWIVAVCWNNGIRLYSTNQNCFAKKWMTYALKFAEKCNHAIYDRIFNLYNEIYA